MITAALKHNDALTHRLVPLDALDGRQRQLFAFSPLRDDGCD